MSTYACSCDVHVRVSVHNCGPYACARLRGWHTEVRRDSLKRAESKSLETAQGCTSLQHSLEHEQSKFSSACAVMGRYQGNCGRSRACPGQALLHAALPHLERANMICPPSDEAVVHFMMVLCHIDG
jgi:hypothetical protein